MPNIIFNFFGDKSCPAGLQQTISSMLSESQVLPTTQPQMPSNNASNEPDISTALNNTTMRPISQEPHYALIPQPSIFHHPIPRQLIPHHSSIPRPSISHHPRHQMPIINPSSFSSIPRQEMPSTSTLCPRTMPIFNPLIQNAAIAGHRSGHMSFDMRLFNYLINKQNITDHDIGGCENLELDAFNTCFQMLNFNENPNYETSLKAISLIEKRMNRPGKLGSTSCNFKMINDRWVMSIRQPYFRHLKKKIKLSNLLCIFVHDCNDGENYIERAFLQVHRCFGFSSNYETDSCVVGNNYADGTEFRFRAVYIIDNYFDQADMMSRKLRTPTITDYSVLSTLSYIAFLACCVKLEVCLCYRCQAVTSCLHHHNDLLVGTNKEVYNDILWDSQNGFLDDIFRQQILAQHALQYHNENIQQVSLRTAHYYSIKYMLSFKMLDHGYTFCLETNFEQIREKGFYEIKDGNVFDRNSLNFISLSSLHPFITACACKMEFSSQYLASNHFCLCLGYQSISGKELIDMLAAHVY